FHRKIAEDLRHDRFRHRVCRFG
ncbi:hypothetical protein A2U01_0078929, partial [Trifolium medium]|nr:hypothetical protein [Trifolium medium]